MEVTREDYDNLERRLNQNFSDRNLPDYDDNDVLSYKLDILKRDATTEPQHINNDVDNGDDPETIDSLFPSTFRFLDLSTVLKVTSRRFPLAIFVREEYNIITNLINKRSKNRRGTVIVSGQPGTGTVLCSTVSPRRI